MHQYASKPYKNLRSSPFTQFFKLLADKSRDLYQADMKITVFKAKQIQKLQLFSLKMTTFEHFVSLLSLYNSLDKSRDISANDQLLEQM